MLRCFYNQANKLDMNAHTISCVPDLQHHVLNNWPAKAKNDKEGCVCVGGSAAYVQLSGAHGEFGFSDAVKWEAHVLQQQWIRLAMSVSTAGLLCLPRLTQVWYHFFFRLHI